MTRFQSGLLTLLSLLCAAAVAGILSLTALNRTAQSEVNVRQQFVQQSLQLETLYRDIVRTLAELAARNNDAQVRDLLARHGITYSANPAPAAAAAAPRK